MKQVKIYGEALEWLKDLEVREDRELRRGDYNIPRISNVLMRKKVKRKIRK